MSKLLIETKHTDGVCVLRVQGRLETGSDLETLRAQADEIKSHPCGQLLADFREVTSVGSTGIGFVVGIYTSITKSPGGKFVLVGLSPRVREVFDLTRLTDVIPWAEDIESGLAVLCEESPTLREAGQSRT
jgi:anti-anti-sigma factor